MRRSDFVNVLIGTAGVGQALVGPQMPHGMVKLSPDTFSLSNVGYDYNDDTILGFSHTRIEGIGGAGGRGHLLLMPANGALVTDETKFASKYSHKQEVAEVGYYAVDLKKYGIRTEMSAAQNSSIFRFTYPSGEDSRLMIDLSHTLHTYQSGRDGFVRQTADNELSGYGVYPLGSPSTPNMIVYFVLRADRPFSKVLYWKGDEVFDDASRVSGKHVGAIPYFAADDGAVVTVKVGISYISTEQAARNLDAQIPDYDLEAVVEKCKAAWDDALACVDIDTDDDTQRRIFYSGLYRSLNQPAQYDEVGGDFFIGADGNKHVKNTGRHFYSDIWAIWDTFRTTHPLHHLLEPERQDDVAQSIMENYYVADKLPMSPAPCYGLAAEMIGHHAVSAMAESYAKGRRNFDYEAAYAAMKHATTRTDIGSEGIPEEYARLGYMPADEEDAPHDFSVSATLELTYDDWCTSEMAKALGFEEDHKFLSERAKNYKNVFDPKLGFVRRKRADGTWVDPFDPGTSHKDGFCETTPWEYTSLVPHDVQGMINLMGGDEKMIEHIDGTFSHDRFNHTNETAFHIPFIYTFARAPYKTMEVCRNFMPTVHTNEPAGIFGEDDSGALSAWFIFIALGLFPSCPARPCYTLTSPAFPRWTLRLPEGKKFTVIAKNNSKENIYIQSASLNGQPLTRTWIAHDEIMAGGELVYEMGSAPSDWGTRFEDAPPSLTTDVPKFTVLAVDGEHTVKAGKPATVTVTLRNDGADGSLDCKIFASGLLLSREVCYLDANSEGTFTLTYTAYDEDTREIIVCGVPFALTLTDLLAPALVYGAAKADRPMRTHTDRAVKFAISATVKNVGSYETTAEIPCTLDGILVETQTIELEPGEEKTVTFTANPLTIGNHYAAIGDGEAVEIDVCGKPSAAEWICWRGADAEFGVAGDNLYINAAGFMDKDPHFSNRMEYGILWSRFPVEGDFDATVRVAFEEYVTPYTALGIIVKNSLEMPWVDVSGTIQNGAMTTRGFSQRAYTDKEDDDNLAWALGNPTAPYWLKVEKRGQHFDCYYSEDDRKTWVRQGGYTCDDAARTQYVGLYANSCIVSKRLVKFTDWNITLVRI
ncbi:MAG: DUF1349 domain-containing protein [Ruminococcaceae bacterium]|nr:DUF1349 domain-containing protein [Oscillospiraceae bacterium]